MVVGDYFFLYECLYWICVFISVNADISKNDLFVKTFLYYILHSHNKGSSKVKSCFQLGWYLMPVGVPKVPYTILGDDEASWVDLYYLLFRQRLLFLGQEVNSEIANQLAGSMIYLSLEDNTKDLFLFINSPGGEVISGMGVFDTMQFVKAEVQTVCVGLAASMASLLLIGGEITKRLAFPHAWRQ